MTVRAFCDRCDENEVRRNGRNQGFIEFCPIDDDFKATGQVDILALLCKECLKEVLLFIGVDRKLYSTKLFDHTDEE